MKSAKYQCIVFLNQICLPWKEKFQLCKRGKEKGVYLFAKLKIIYEHNQTVIIHMLIYSQYFPKWDYISYLKKRET